MIMLENRNLLSTKDYIRGRIGNTNIGFAPLYGTPEVIQTCLKKVGSTKVDSCTCRYLTRLTPCRPAVLVLSLQLYSMSSRVWMVRLVYFI